MSDRKPHRASETRVAIREPAKDAFPNLRIACADKAILIVGGLVIAEKVDLCARRFGVRVEWVEAENGPRLVDAVAKRIRSGRVGAVMLLHAFIPHKTNDRVVAACRAARVACVLTGRGGIGAIEGALHEIEKRFTEQELRSKVG